MSLLTTACATRPRAISRVARRVELFHSVGALQNEPNTTIEAKHYTPEQADDALTQALRGKKGRLTKADAITVSGLPSYVVDESLERLLKAYKSRLEVTDDGELLYSLGPGMVRRDDPTLRA